LLTGLIDYAGLFPPAALAMPEAVANFGAYRAGEFAWALGRFVVSAARLPELGDCILRQPKAVPWQVAALAGPNLANDLAAIAAFNERCAGIAQVDTLELKAESASHIAESATLIPQALARYFELPVADDPTPLLRAVAAVHSRAKIRTGAVTAAGFPSAASLARFLRAGAALPVAFKATAGLHHPLRGVYRLTYEPDSASALMHGFLNVFLAAAFARDGMVESELVLLLEERAAEAFAFSENGVIWRGRELRLNELREAREEFAISFGSCSFTEPIDDLKGIHLL
jgi:hypothetical protein